MKSNAIKLRAGICYNTILDKLGYKVKSVAYEDKLIEAIINLLDEAAIEIRNIGKIGMHTLKGIIPSEMELNALLMKCSQNDRKY